MVDGNVYAKFNMIYHNRLNCTKIDVCVSLLLIWDIIVAASCASCDSSIQDVYQFLKEAVLCLQTILHAFHYIIYVMHIVLN